MKKKSFFHSFGFEMKIISLSKGSETTGKERKRNIRHLSSEISGVQYQGWIFCECTEQKIKAVGIRKRKQNLVQCLCHILP